MAQEATQEKKKKGGLFGDLSVAQLIAGALAAATSMLLASQIGIAGSVIGVAVGSIVSAVASQLYKRFLTVSAEKIRVLQPNATTPDQAETDEVDSSHALPPHADASSTARMLDVSASAEETLAAGATSVLRPLTVRCSKTPRVDDETLQNDITVQRARALRERKTKFRRRVLAVSVFSGFAAVLVSASVVGFLTMGEGLGAKASLFVETPPQSQSSEQKGAAGGLAPSSDSNDKGSVGESSGDQSTTTDKPNNSSGTESGGQQEPSGSQDSPAGGSGGSGSTSGGAAGDTGSIGGSGSADSSGAAGGSGTTGDSGTTDSPGGTGGSNGTSGSAANGSTGTAPTA